MFKVRRILNRKLHVFTLDEALVDVKDLVGSLSAILDDVSALRKYRTPAEVAALAILARITGFEGPEGTVPVKDLRKLLD